jgi:hypothetical protein
LHLSHSNAYRENRFFLLYNVDWYDVDFGLFTPAGSIYLMGCWWDENDDNWEHSWSVEIRKSKKNYRILLRANIHSHLHPVFWKQMTDEVIPLLNEFIQNC